MGSEMCIRDRYMVLRSDPKPVSEYVREWTMDCLYLKKGYAKIPSEKIPRAIPTIIEADSTILPLVDFKILVSGSGRIHGFPI